MASKSTYREAPKLCSFDEDEDSIFKTNHIILRKYSKKEKILNCKEKVSKLFENTHKSKLRSTKKSLLAETLIVLPHKKMKDERNSFKINDDLNKITDINNKCDKVYQLHHADDVNADHVETKHTKRKRKLENCQDIEKLNLTNNHCIKLLEQQYNSTKDSLYFCDICKANISQLSAEKRQAHVNLCLDTKQTFEDEKIAKQLQLSEQVIVIFIFFLIVIHDKLDLII